MVEDEQLRTLFRAFRERNEHAFQRVAESIIADRLAANKQAAAADLRQALAGREPQSSGHVLRSVPRDRRGGDELVSLRESNVDQTRIILTPTVRPKIERILLEHRHEYGLLQYGLAAKRKLLFWGPPGCGKTLTAFHIAHELGLPIGVVRLHALISSFLGDTASNLQRVFDVAASRPMVLLFDEVDAIGKQRDDVNDVGELKRVVSSLLQAIDSYTGKSLMIAATNHQYLLDPALWRRFDDVIEFPLPNKTERDAFLRHALSGVRTAGSLGSVAERSDGLSFDDLRRIVTEAVKTMALNNKKVVSVTELNAALRDLRHVGRSSARPNRRAKA